MTRHELEVAIVHHRTPTLLARALERLARYAPDVPVLVVDTALDPSLPHQLDGAHPRLRWRAVPNHSYAAAVNAAIRSTERPLLLQMNADVFVDATTLDALAAPFADPAVAAAGPLVRTPSGALQDQGLPYRLHQARARWVRRSAGAGSGVDVPWLSGCLQVLRRDALRSVGGFDARLRFYNEDLEWCLRARRAGWRCRLVADEVVHVGGASTTRRLPLLLEGVRGGFVVTNRHAAPWLRPLHRLGIAVGASLASRRADDATARDAWGDLAARAWRGTLHEGRLGAQLDQTLC